MKHQVQTFVGMLMLLSTNVSVDGATLSMRWQGTSAEKISVSNSSTAVVEVVVELSPAGGDMLQGVFFGLEPTVNIFSQPVATHVSNDTSVPNWSPGGVVNLPLGPSQFAVAADSPTDLISGATTVVVGTFTLQFGNLTSPFEWELAFEQTGAVQLLDESGGFYTFTANPAYFAYSGYFTYGKGSPGVTQMSNVIPRDPLVFSYLVPEPASLVLLVMAGLAVSFSRRTRAS